MGLLGLAATALLALVGYSAGSVSLRGREASGPAALDLLLAAGCLVLAVAARGWWGHWLGLAAGVGAGWLVGFAASALLERPARPVRRAPRAAKDAEPRPGDDAGPEPGGWRRFALALGDFQGRLFLSFLYFLVLAPVGLAARLASDPLELESRPGTAGWKDRPPSDESAEDRLRRQY